MRFVRFVFHNWPLKLGAIALATILYGGMLILQNAGSWDSQVQIEVKNQPPQTELMSTLPSVTRIRYIAASDVPITRSTFKASIDLSGVQAGTGRTALVKVDVTAEDDRIRVLDYDPSQVTIVLEPVIQRQVTVVVNRGPTPSGLTADDPVITPTTVTVLGAESKVQKVVDAQGAIAIEPSGLDVDQEVPLTPVDANGNEVQDIKLTPSTVRVHVTVNSQVRTTNLPVNPMVTGSPAPGYVVASVDVEPAVVELRGQADQLAQLKAADTQPVSIAGATSDITQQVPLALPSRVTATGVTTVKVTVHLQALTGTRTVQIGIVPDGARSDRVYNLSTTSVTVTIGGPIATLNVFDTSTLVGTVSVGNLDPGKHTVNVSVVLPPNVRPVSIQPTQIVVEVVVAAPSASPTPPPTPSPT